MLISVINFHSDFCNILLYVLPEGLFMFCCISIHVVHLVQLMLLVHFIKLRYVLQDFYLK